MSFATNFQTDSTRAATYCTSIISNTNGFLSPSGATWNNQTDQILVQRQELLAFRSSTGFSSNALQDLSTFSREGVVQPSAHPAPAFYGAAAGTPQWSPATPTATNPNFQTLFVTQSFTRNDGTTNVGDYLVNRRFLLQRLNWLTYKGPSASRTIPASAPPIGDPNYDMWLLTGSNRTTSGFTSSFLQLGTAANIQKYFGLVWDTTNERWNYVGQGGSLLASIATLGVSLARANQTFLSSYRPESITTLLAMLSHPTRLCRPFIKRPRCWKSLRLGRTLLLNPCADSYPCG